jgi:hypothetical protein
VNRATISTQTVMVGSRLAPKANTTTLPAIDCVNVGDTLAAPFSVATALEQK